MKIKELLLVLSVCGFCLVDGGCGGSGGGATVPTPNSGPVPVISALSPNSSAQGGPAFTLSVVGSNFVPGATVQLNGGSLNTTFTNSTLVTAAVPASALSTSGPD